MAGTLQNMTVTINSGQVYEVRPACKIRFTDAGSPTWKWEGLRHVTVTFSTADSISKSLLVVPVAA